MEEKQDKEIKKDNRIEIKRGFEELWNAKWKFFILVPVVITAIYFLVKYIRMDHTLLKNICDNSYPIIKAIISIFSQDSTFDAESLFSIVKNIMVSVVFVIEMLVVLLVVVFIGKTPSSNTIQNKISNIQFKEGLKPKYRGKKRDKKRKHGKILKFECEGLIEDDYIEKTERIESALRKYKIYRVIPDKLDNAIMYLYYIPNKYAKPMLITKDTNFEQIFNLNLLLTRFYTVLGKSTSLLTLMNSFLRTHKNGIIILVSYKPTKLFVPFRETNNYYEYTQAKERSFEG